jgi:hypothetical protein
MTAVALRAMAGGENAHSTRMNTCWLWSWKAPRASGWSSSPVRPRTYQIIFGDRSVPMLLYDLRREPTVLRSTWPQLRTCSQTRRRGRRLPRVPYVREQVYNDITKTLGYGAMCFEALLPRACGYSSDRSRGTVCSLLHRLALFVRRSDDLWPAKLSGARRSARRCTMDQEGASTGPPCGARRCRTGVHQRPYSTAASGSRRACVRSSRACGWTHPRLHRERLEDISGSSNHMTETQGVQLMRQEAGPDGVGRSLYLGGGKDAGLRISKGWPSGREHTFCTHHPSHTAPRAASGTGSVTGSPGHHGDRGGRAHQTRG